MAKIKVFLSSAMNGELDNERDCISVLFNNDSGLKDFTEFYKIENHCNPYPIQKAYLSEVRDTNVLIIIFNQELRDPVKEEFFEAKKFGKYIFCYIKNNKDKDRDLNDFILSEIYPNFHCGNFNSSVELTQKIKNDLEENIIKTYKNNSPVDEQVISHIERADINKIYVNNRQIDQHFVLQSDIESDLFNKVFNDPSDLNQTLGMFITNLEKSKNENEYTNFDWYFKGTFESLNGQYEKAILSWKQALLLNFNEPIIYHDIGSSYMRLKDFKNAISNYDKAITSFPDLFFLYNDRGLAKYALKKYDESIIDYNKSISLKPDESSLYNNRGNAYAALGNEVKSFEDYNKAISFFDKNWIPYFDRAHFSRELGKIEDAIKDYEKANELNPSDSRALNNLGNIYLEEKKNFAKAIKYFTESIKLDKTNASYYSNRAFAYLGNNEFELSEKDCNVAINLDPSISASYLCRARVFIEKREFNKAIQDLDKIIEIGEEKSLFYAYDHKGHIYNQILNYEEAIINYNLALKIKEDFNTYATLIELNINNNTFNEASDILLKYDGNILNQPRLNIFLFFKLIIHLILDLEYLNIEKDFCTEIEKNNNLDSWSFEKFHQWLINSNLSNYKKEKIGLYLNMFKI